MFVTSDLMEHSCSETPLASVAVKAKFEAEVRESAIGDWVIVITGPVLSIVQRYIASCEVFPALSLARTLKVCSPVSKRVYAFGLVQSAGVDPSSEQRYPATPLAASVDVKLNEADCEVVRTGVVVVIVGTVGGVAS